MKIRPLYDRIVVKRIEEQETVRGGIIIPDSAKEKPQEGEVVAVGNGKRLEDGKMVPLDVKVGDRVLTSGHDGLFPRGFAIGTVEQADRRAGVWTIKVRPAVEFSHLDVVLVLLEKVTLPAPGGGS